MTYATYMPAETVDETAQSAGVEPDASFLDNFTSPSSATRALVMVWFVALGAYWLLGGVFRKRLG